MTATARKTDSFDAAAPLADRFAAWRADNPRGYLRNAASDLGVSELEVLVASGGETLTPLRLDDVPGLLGAIAA